jgi:hypothetical protein
MVFGNRDKLIGDLMLSWLAIQWMKRPLVVLAGLFVIALAIDAIAMMWGERRPAAAFFEEFVAQLVHWGTALGSAGAGIWSGIKVFEKTRSNWLGWMSGIAVFVAIGCGVLILSSRIPGVGWRIERMMDRD